MLRQKFYSFLWLSRTAAAVRPPSRKSRLFPVRQSRSILQSPRIDNLYRGRASTSGSLKDAINVIPQLRLVCVGIVLPGGFRDESSDPELASLERALADFALG